MGLTLGSRLVTEAWEAEGAPMRSGLGGHSTTARAGVWGCSSRVPSFIDPEPRALLSLFMTQHQPQQDGTPRAGGRACGGRGGGGQELWAWMTWWEGGRKIVETGEGLGSISFLSPGQGHRKSNPRASQGAS